MSKLKYVRKFDEFKQKRKLNELFVSTPPPPTTLDTELSIQQTTSKGSENTISLQQAMQLTKGIPPTKIRIIVSRATRPDLKKLSTNKTEAYKHYAWYNHKDFVSNLPGGTQTHYLVGTKKSINDAINGTGPILGDFKFISRAEAEKLGCNKKENWGVYDVTDYIKIGDQEVEGEGSITTDLSQNQGDTVVISGNYLWTVIRMVQQQRQLTEKVNVIRFEVGGEKLTGVEQFAQVTEYNMLIKVDHSNSMKNLYYLAECSLPEAKRADMSGKQVVENGEVFNISSISYMFPTTGGRSVANFMGKSDNQIADEMTLMVNSYLQSFLPSETVDGKTVKVETPGLTLEEFSKEDMMKLLTEFKNATHEKRFDEMGSKELKGSNQGSERDKVFKEFIKQFKEKYKKNINQYCKNFLGQDVVDLSKLESNIDMAEWQFLQYTDGTRSHAWNTVKKGAGKETKLDASKTSVIGSTGKPGEIKTYEK